MAICTRIQSLIHSSSRASSRSPISRFVRCFVHESKEYVSERILSTVSLLLRTTSWSHKCWISMCFALPKPVLPIMDNAALESMRGRIGTAPPKSLANAPTVASVLFCFGGAGGKNVLLHHPGLDIVCLVPSPRQQERVRQLDKLAIQTDTQLVAFQRGTDPLSSCSSGLAGPVLRQAVQPRRGRTDHCGLLMPNSKSMLPSLSSALVIPWPPLLAYGLDEHLPSPKDLITSFKVARVCFHPKKPSETPSCRSVEDLELLVQARGFSDHLRLNLVLLFELVDQPPSVFPGSDVITVCRGADPPPLCKPISSKKPPKLAFPDLRSVTGAVQTVSQQPTLPTAWSSSVSFGNLDVKLSAPPSLRSTLFARQLPRALSPSGCLTLPPR